MKSKQAFVSKFAVLIVTAGIFTGCASEAEKQARRENAFDLEGTYTATAGTGSAFEFVMSVANESGRHDVIARMDRSVALTAQESAFLQNRHAINPGTVSSYFTKLLVLGRGSQNELEGGENISDDFGESSRVTVCSDTLKYNSTQSVGYCLRGTIRKADYILRGELTLYVTTEVKKIGQDGKEYTEYDTDSTALSFNANPENQYYSQLFGEWSGSAEINEDFAAEAGRVSSMTLSKLNETTFQASPGVTSITIQGLVYTFESKSFATAQLSGKSIPLVEINFKHSDTERVVFLAQIRSLGNMTGSIFWISGANRTQVGSFLFKKR